jgi:hypothetical protein
MTNTHRYYGGHAYTIYKEATPLMMQIVTKLG